MTREEILAMEPGRKMDTEVALRVLGIKEVTVVGKHYFIDPLDTVLPAYSSKISAVWEVVEKLASSHSIFHLAKKWDEYEAVFVPNGKTEGIPAHSCKSAPEAICKAALFTELEGGEPSAS
ncbi:BC1872 family protein [Paenibacillus sp. GYB003]|uniref:BC1872 family protein n=1 Tax=Paenibacillus sp. GYB003 TaxID=2994392 RepID=UPI002F96C06E